MTLQCLEMILQAGIAKNIAHTRKRHPQNVEILLVSSQSAMIPTRSRGFVGEETYP